MCPVRGVRLGVEEGEGPLAHDDVKSAAIDCKFPIGAVHWVLHVVDVLVRLLLQLAENAALPAGKTSFVGA